MRQLEREHGGCSTDTDAVARLERIGKKLTKKIDSLPVTCQFFLLNDGAPNAYSLSCGCVYVTRGLYDKLKSDGLLAAALAHELAHVAVQDGKRPCSDRSCQLAKELSADKKAIDYLRKSGFETQPLVDLVVLLRAEQPTGWAEQRREQIESELSRMQSSLAAATKSRDSISKVGSP
jgi:predicted Zn-dependent protease